MKRGTKGSEPAKDSWRACRLNPVAPSAWRLAAPNLNLRINESKGPQVKVLRRGIASPLPALLVQILERGKRPCSCVTKRNAPGWALLDAMAAVLA